MVSHKAGMLNPMALPVSVATLMSHNLLAPKKAGTLRLLAFMSA